MIYLKLFYTFFIIGLFSFGGGAGMLPLIEQKVVGEHMWMSATELYRFVGIAESTPGPIAVNIATALGYTQGDLLGSLCATLGVVMPSFMIILIVASFFKKFAQYRVVKAVLEGIKAIVVGMMAVITIKIASVNIFSTFNIHETFIFNLRPLLITLIIIGIYFLYKLIFKKAPKPILIIIVSAITGVLIYL